MPDTPLQFSFLDDKMEALYKAEQRWGRIVGWAGGISIFLAGLGLFGLAALVSINRIKEIGIRKVLGATVLNIVSLISKDFLKLIAIAFLIATPIAWLCMKKWLQSFDYRINISIGVFMVVGLLTVLLALATIAIQAIRAALSNPVKSLRSE